MACDRAQLEAQYQHKTKCQKPAMEEQGSDTFLKKQFRYCMKGEIGFFTSRQIISLLPETEERPIKKRKTLAQALEGEDEEEPEDEDQAHRSKVLHQDCNDRAAGTKDARETIQHQQYQQQQQHERLSRQERPCKYQGLLLVSEESSIEKCKAGQHELHQCHAN
jgi:hypothetical protein